MPRIGDHDARTERSRWPEYADRIDSLREEHRVLREHLGPRPLRLTDAQRRRRAVRGQKLGRRIVSQGAGIVTPDTILRWYRRLIAQQYDGRARRCRRRPMTPRAVAELVGRMAGEHPMWGYTRIRGALANLSHNIAWNTVKRILHDHAVGRRWAAIGQTSGATQRCLNPGFIERIGNSRRTGSARFGSSSVRPGRGSLPRSGPGASPHG